MQFGDKRLSTRTWNLIVPVPFSGCWLWLGHLNWGGYGPHRVIYGRLVGSVAKGIDLDHLCRVRCCVNPAHLEPVTRSENLRRGDNGAVIRARMALRTHCPSGHEYTPENTYYRNQGRWRDCLTCRRARSDAYNKQVSGETRLHRQQ